MSREDVVECRSWRTYDDDDLDLIEGILSRIDPDSWLGKAVEAAGVVFAVGCLSGIIPALLMWMLGVEA